MSREIFDEENSLQEEVVEQNEDKIDALMDENQRLIEEVNGANLQIERANLTMQDLQVKLGRAEGRHSLLTADVKIAQSKEEEE